MIVGVEDNMNVTLSQEGSNSYTSLMQQMNIFAHISAQNNQLEPENFNYLLEAPVSFENNMFMTSSRIDYSQRSTEDLQETHSDIQQENQVTANIREDEAKFGNEADEQITLQDENMMEEDNNNYAQQEENQSGPLTEEDIEIYLENESIKAIHTAGQEAESKHLPYIDMTFATDEEAHTFYNDYAFIVGFSVSKAGNYHSRSKKNLNKVTRVTFKCNKTGKSKDEQQNTNQLAEGTTRNKVNTQKEKTTSPKPTARERKSNTIKKTACPAEMVVTLTAGLWHITRLNLDHNHELTPQGETKFLRSNKHMTTEEKMLIRTFNHVKIPNRMIMAILSYLRGGLSAVPYTKKDVSNFRTSIRKEASINDMMQVMEYFSKKQANDPLFFYSFETDEDNRVRNIFWADGRCRSYYELYGDCVSFDTTYKTNKYNLPFAPFVGITGHGHNCLFGCAFLKDETIATFEWLFKTLLTCMGGKAPTTIITDQDGAMKAAIASVFPYTNHRNCLFHIMKKAQEKTGRCLDSKPGLHDEFHDIVNNSLTETEFETLWQEMIQKNGLQSIKYFQVMWQTRKRFVPVYFKQQFYPFIQTTARSEGTNSVFKKKRRPNIQYNKFPCSI